MTQNSYVFLDRHEPRLSPGEHTLTVMLDVAVEGAKEERRATKFWVGGERFSLGPAGIHSVYPPEGSRGLYGHCLPHVALRRDTLPWERKADGARAPWLALLVLSAAEAASCPLETVTLEDYFARLATRPAPEPGQAISDQVQVLALPAALWALIPSPSELASLCHVRGELVGGELKESVAVVVGKRLPRPGRNTVHLVSLEGRYAGEVLDGHAPSGTVVSLKSWSFVCETDGNEETESLADLFQGLDGSWLRIPKDSGPAEAFLSRGRAPLPHRFRTGESGVSWYAGPLAPGPAAEDGAELVRLPAGSADELLWYHEAIGMLDITYAAAWELGRLLALERREIEIALSAWRRQQILDARTEETSREPYASLPQLLRARADGQRRRAAPPSGKPPQPEVLVDWLSGVWQLAGIPFKYLVPDERMLPTESIRFFSVNARWIDAVLDGALSLTRSAGDPGKRSVAEKALLDAAPRPPVITGFLLRSAIVSGWPDLDVHAKGADARPVDVYHRAQLSPSIVMYLFAGRAGTITLRQHRSTVHLEAGSALAIGAGEPSSALARRLAAKSQVLEVAVPW